MNIYETLRRRRLGLTLILSALSWLEIRKIPTGAGGQRFKIWIVSVAPVLIEY
jgi:hypothetical protein